MAVDVVVVGSLNLDLVATAARHPAPGETVAGLGYHEYAGGKGLNQAVAAARAGATVAMVGCVGSDEAGRRLVDLASDEGIDTSGIRIADGADTGRALIVVDERGENSIVVVAGANALVTADVELPESRVVLTQLEIPVPTVAAVCRRARDAGATTLLDPAPASGLPPELVAACSIVLPNEHEVELAGGAPRLLADGCGRVVVTRGADGAEVIGPDGAFRHDAIRVDVVDTTGAGDAFRGAFAARLAAGDPVSDAVEFAIAAGALATTVTGAVPSLPRRGQIDALLRTGGASS